MNSAFWGIASETTTLCWAAFQFQVLEHGRLKRKRNRNVLRMNAKVEDRWRAVTQKSWPSPRAVPLGCSIRC